MKQPAKDLSSSLEHHLSAYTLAATAAGVGVLGLTRPAEAKIVYTPANVKIVQNGGLVPIDLNHDGIPDFGLSNIYSRTSYQANALLQGRAGSVDQRDLGRKQQGLSVCRCLTQERPCWT